MMSEARDNACDSTTPRLDAPTKRGPPFRFSSRPSDAARETGKSGSLPRLHFAAKRRRNRTSVTSALGMAIAVKLVGENLVVDVVTLDDEVLSFAYRRFRIMLLPKFNSISLKVGIRNFKDVRSLTARLA
jgi:hypothetical protein